MGNTGTVLGLVSPVSVYCGGMGRSLSLRLLALCGNTYFAFLDSSRHDLQSLEGRYAPYITTGLGGSRDRLMDGWVVTSLSDVQIISGRVYDDRLNAATE